jgi:hypothetical protein
VSKQWNDLTRETVKHPTKQELKQTIRLITEKLHLGQHAQYIKDLAEIQNARQPKPEYLASQLSVGESFLVVKGFVILERRKTRPFRAVM